MDGSRGRLVFLLAAVFFSFLAGSCSVPNLEKPECSAAREAVRRFYSFHLANDMASSRENLKERERYLTESLTRQLSEREASSTDYFTATDRYPRAFRVGECKTNSASNASLQVLLLWRDDVKSEQKEVRVEAVRSGSEWLVNGVSQ